MNSENVDIVEADREPSPLKVGLGATSLILPWSLLLYQLSITWQTNEQYAHGFLVPILCLYLLTKATIPIAAENEAKPKTWLEGKEYEPDDSKRLPHDSDLKSWKLSQSLLPERLEAVEDIDSLVEKGTKLGQAGNGKEPILWPIEFCKIWKRLCFLLRNDSA